MLKWEGSLYQILLIAAAGCFLAGVLLPLMTVEKFYFLENRFSILTALTQFIENKQYALLVLIAGFSVVLPVAKILVLQQTLYALARKRESHQHSRIMLWVHRYGKWSMLDVFVVAVLVVALKLDAVASVKIHSGLYFFAASILLTMALSARLISISAKADPQTR